MICHMTFELATLLMFLNVNLRLIFSTLPMLLSHVSSPAPTNNILDTYGTLQVLYCIVMYNVSLQENLMSTIGKKLACMPPNLVNYGPNSAENDWRVFAHRPKFSHWKTLPALPHARYITDSRQTLARVM